MANIPLLDIPSVPNADISMPAAQGKIPDFPKLREIGARMENPFNFTQHIRGLQQEGISPGAIAAIGAANAQVADSIVNFGTKLGRLALELERSKSTADVSRGMNMAQDTWSAFNIEADEKKLLPTERQKLWAEEYAPRLNSEVEGLGLSSWSRSELLPKLHSFVLGKNADLQHNATVFQIESDKSAHRAAIDNALANGDLPAAKEANHWMTFSGHQSKEEEAMHDRQIEGKYAEWEMGTQMNIDPRVVLREMDEAKATGKSDLYPNVKDPAVIDKWQSAARSAVNVIETDTQRDLENRIREGELTTMEEVKTLANGKLPADRLDALEKQLFHDPIFDPEAVEGLRTKVKNYDGVKDNNLAEYNAIHDEITTKVPKYLQQVLSNELYSQQVQTRKGELKGADQKFLGSLYREIDGLGKGGYFGPTGRDPKNPNRILDWNAHLGNYEKVTDAKNHMTNWLKEHPNATTKEATDELKNMVGEAGADQADREMRKRNETIETYRREFLPQAGFSTEPKGATKTAGGLGNDDLVSAVKSMEGFTPSAQWDFKQWSVGYGTRGKAGETISEKEADLRLREELAVSAQNIDRAASARGMRLTTGQRNALISFDFNTGRGAKLIETAASVEELGRRMGLYTKVNQNGELVELDGLVKRRKREQAMFVQ